MLAIAHSAAFGSGPARAAGVLLVDVYTGEQTHAGLTAPGQHTHNDPQLSAWSSGQCLLVHREDISEETCTVDAIDVRGRLLQTATFPANTIWLQPDCWGPDGQAALLQGARTIWIWQPLDHSQPIRSQLITYIPGASSCAWCPDFCKLLIARRTPAVLLWAGQDSQQLHSVPGVTVGAHAVMCGSHGRVAFLCKALSAQSAVSWKVMLYCVRGRSDLCLLGTYLVPERLVSWISTMAGQNVSPDGTHFCLAVQSSVTSLYLFSMAGHWQLRLDVPFRPRGVSWTATCSRLLVWDETGLRTLLLDFT